jgi:hypothetical protein
MSDPADSNQPDAQPTPDDGHDQLEEAIARARYEKRMAAAEIPGDGDLFIVARVNEYDVPELTTRAGGKIDTKATVNEESYVEYAGGTSLTREFDRVDDLDLAFSALVEKHDLDELEADDGGEDA